MGKAIDAGIGPGEKRTRRRRRMMWGFYLVALLVGGLLGIGIKEADGGLEEIFRAGPPTATLDFVPTVLLAAGLLLGLVILPLSGFLVFDELEREGNMIAMTAGTAAVWGGYPIWAVLAAGGIAGPPHALGMFLLSMTVSALTFVWAKYLR